MTDPPRSERVERCPSCGTRGKALYRDAPDRLFGVPGRWNVVECPACRMAWLDPRPTADAIPDLYRDYFTHASEREGPSKRRGLKRALIARVCGYEPARERSMAATLLSAAGPVREAAEGAVMWLPAERRGRLLDVGCGDGRFLAEMRDLGWDVVGVEPDPEAARTARERAGLDVRTGTLDDAAFDDRTFDAVTLNHVIEHVADPVATLRECGRVTRADGRVVVVTPNTRALGRRIFGPSWVGWDPPRHLLLFTPAHLGRVADRAGLRVLEIGTTARAARYIWEASRLLAQRGTLPGARPHPLPRHVRLEAAAFWAVDWLASRLGPFGEEILLVGTPAAAAAGPRTVG